MLASTNCLCKEVDEFQRKLYTTSEEALKVYNFLLIRSIHSVNMYKKLIKIKCGRLTKVVVWVFISVLKVFNATQKRNV
jgi:hypothetical protein